MKNQHKNMWELKKEYRHYADKCRLINGCIGQRLNKLISHKTNFNVVSQIITFTN